jgi:hypothetical protein
MSEGPWLLKETVLDWRRGIDRRLEREVRRVGRRPLWTAKKEKEGDAEEDDNSWGRRRRDGSTFP